MQDLIQIYYFYCDMAEDAFNDYDQPKYHMYSNLKRLLEGIIEDGFSRDFA